MKRMVFSSRKLSRVVPMYDIFWIFRKTNEIPTILYWFLVVLKIAHFIKKIYHGIWITDCSLIKTYFDTHNYCAMFPYLFIVLNLPHWQEVSRDCRSIERLHHTPLYTCLLPRYTLGETQKGQIGHGAA
jgi:hypothetical protein